MGARHVVQSVFVRSTDIVVSADKVELSVGSTVLLNEAILHFSYAVRAATALPMLGHPQPYRSNDALLLTHWLVRD